MRVRGYFAKLLFLSYDTCVSCSLPRTAEHATKQAHKRKRIARSQERKIACKRKRIARSKGTQNSLCHMHCLIPNFPAMRKPQDSLLLNPSF